VISDVSPAWLRLGLPKPTTRVQIPDVALFLLEVKVLIVISFL
jgi:hypothetical protein